MNFRLGLRRMSATLWGLLGAFFVVLFVFWSAEGSMDLDAAFKLVGILGGLYFLHRLTCWIVDGFFSPK